MQLQMRCLSSGEGEVLKPIHFSAFLLARPMQLPALCVGLLWGLSF